MKKQNKKKTIITVTAVVLVVVIGLGVWFGVSRGRSEPVKVFAFNYVGMTEYWGDSQESYGPVSTDKIQTVFLSSTQTVTEMKVAQGDMVKKGDVLMTFDTTLSDLQLERKRLKVLTACRNMFVFRQRNDIGQRLVLRIGYLHGKTFCPYRHSRIECRFEAEPCACAGSMGAVFHGFQIVFKGDVMQSAFRFRCILPEQKILPFCHGMKC